MNPNKPSALSNRYHLDESTFVLRGIGSEFSFLFHVSMTFMSANRIALDVTARFAASSLGLFCLPMSHIRTLGLYGLIKQYMKRSSFKRAVNQKKEGRQDRCVYLKSISTKYTK